MQIILFNAIFSSAILVVGSSVIYIHNTMQATLTQKLLYTGLASLVAGIFVGVLSTQSQVFADFIRTMFEDFMRLSVSNDVIQTYILSLASLFGSTIFLINWLGIAVAHGSYNKRQGKRHVLLRRLEVISLPPQCIWLGIGAFLILVLDGLMVIEQTTLFVVAANIVGILFILYFLQGMGLGVSYLMYRRLSERRINAIMTAIVIASIFPYIGMVVIVGMCVLGIAKLWIRIPERGEDR